MGNKVGIGGEFYLSPNDLSIKEDNIFEYLNNYKTIYFHSGREAISCLYNHLTKSKDGDETRILLPEYICESVIKCFPTNCISFYPVDNELNIDFDFVFKFLSSNKIGFFYLVHYFGKLQDEVRLEKLRELARQQGTTIIEDTTHSIFSKRQTIGDYMISSLRKWFPIPSGAVLYSNKELPSLNLARFNSNERTVGHFLKWLSLKSDLELSDHYRRIFSEEEHVLDIMCDFYEISDYSRFLLSCFSIHKIIETRQQNYEHLKKKISYIPVNGCLKNECPFVLCIDVDNRDELRQYLIENKVFCAVHWPYFELNNEERENSVRLSGRLLSLPIDQRYSESEMNYIAELINRFRNEDA